MRASLFTLIFVIHGLWLESVHASGQVATIVHLKGDVSLFTEESKTAHKGKGQQVLFNENYYLVQPAKIGMKVSSREIVSTGVNGKAKLVFPSGDTFLVAPGTAYSIDSAKAGPDTKAQGTSLNLIYGKLRALVSKAGPMKKLEVKTATAVAGVRGTDFFVKQLGSNTELTVLRGKVEVARLATPEKKETIATGSSAKVEAPEVKTDGTTVEAKPIEVKKATKIALTEIQQDSVIEDKRDLSILSETAQKEIASLEKKATASVLTDIKAHNPELYEKVKDQKDADVTQISESVVATIAEKAPEGSKKPTLKDVEGVNQNPYDKYFKKVDAK